MGCPLRPRVARSRVARLRARSARGNFGWSGLGVIFLGKPMRACPPARSTRSIPAARYARRSSNSGLI